MGEEMRLGDESRYQNTTGGTFPKLIRRPYCSPQIGRKRGMLFFAF